MQCEACGLDLIIQGKSRLQFENDDTGERDTRAFYEFSFTCRNKQCTNYEKIVREERVYLD